MSPLFDTIVQYLQQDQWPVLVVPNQTIAVTRFNGNNGKWECQLHVREEQQQLIFYSVCPVEVSEDKRAAMAEFAARVNYGLTIGNLELGMEDGNVRFKTSLDLSSGATTDSLNPLLYANVALFDHYLPGIMQVLNGAASPREAVAAVEGAATEGAEANRPGN